jgi:hypothetical protein
MQSSTPPQIGVSTFRLINAEAVVYVPPFGSKSAYESTETWKEMNIQSFIEVETSSAPTSCKITVYPYENLASCSIGEIESFGGNVVEYNGLEPNSEYKDILVTLTSTADEIETTTISFSTSALELTTQNSKAVSSTTAILLAETNMADAEVNCGFEWKRNDAPEDMDANKVYCPVASGTMAGRLRNLKDNVYYKYRAFYQSAAGNTYYGDWKYIFTGDVTVEFDPILYTYMASFVSETSATVSGYALAGSEDFTEQGFEYWAESRVTHADAAPLRMPAALGEHQTVQASGIRMQVQLTDLDPGTVYAYRTYAKIGETILYGSTQQFTTLGEWTTPTAIDYAMPNEQCENAKILRDGQIFIRRDGKTYTITGARVK